MLSVADRFAARGCAVLVADMFGRGAQKEAWQRAKDLLRANRAERHVQAARMEASLRALQSQRGVDRSRVVAVGFCYGGQVCAACPPQHRIAPAP